ncbi:methyltransferase domain-containing protein [Planctomycetota bacterium]
MRMLNAGCGAVFHADWVNIDLVSSSPAVSAHDLTRGLAFESGSFDVCYSSHVLEHLRSREASFFIEEQRRVLKPNGIIRVVVPDLEVICRNYLKYLGELLAGDLTHEFRYDYSLLELYDQTTRNVTGGALGRLWASGDIRDPDFVAERHGSEATCSVKRCSVTEAQENARSRTSRIKRLLARGRLRRLGSRARRFASEQALRTLSGEGAVRALREGVFRRSGEIHRVMYDRYSLKRLLTSHGFANVKTCAATESRIPGFSDFQLDVVDGITSKPDSLFMEALRA